MSPSAKTRAVARGDLERLALNTYLVPELADARTPLIAALVACPVAVLSHSTAAAVWRFDAVDGAEVHLTVPHGCRAPLGVVHHSNDLEPFEVRVVDGLRVTDPTRTLCDLGAVCDPVVVERALESALRRRLTSVKRLEWRMHALRRPGRRGPSVLREVLRWRPAGAPPTESELETRYLQVLRDHGVPLPVRQYRVFHQGRLLGRVDLAYPDAEVFVELDGWAFHGTREAFERDRARQNDLVGAGWSPLRFTWADVTERPRQTAERTLSVLA